MSAGDVLVWTGVVAVVIIVAALVVVTILAVVNAVRDEMDK